MFLNTFAIHPFLVKPIFKSIFSLHQHVFFFQWIFFSHFSWQEIWSNIWLEWWGGASSRPQDPCSIFSHGHQGEFFFGFFAWKNVVSCFIESLMVRHYHFVVWLLEFRTLYDWSYFNVGFGAFFEVLYFSFFFFFWSWCNLDNVGGL